MPSTKPEKHGESPLTSHRIETLAEGVGLFPFDCMIALRELDSDSADSCVTDPPYELKFMGKGWDGTGIAFQVETWRRVFRVLKPGAHLLAFGGTRTYHRMTCAIEDAGFEIRDSIQWIYGSGFPKSLDVSRAIDKAAGAERERSPTLAMQRKGDVGEISSNVRCAICGKARASGNPCTCPRLEDIAITSEAEVWSGYGTALKPAHEPIVLARKPLSESTVAANVLKWGTGALNIDGCRVEHQSEADRALATPGGKVTSALRAGVPDVNRDGRVDVARPNTSKGRWPANVIHDGSDEAVGAFPETKSGDCNGETVSADNQIHAYPVYTCGL